jgi:hypothetical protein
MVGGVDEHHAGNLDCQSDLCEKANVDVEAGSGPTTAGKLQDLRWMAGSVSQNSGVD